MQHFDWKHVAIITQEEDIFTLVNYIDWWIEKFLKITREVGMAI